MHTNTRRCRCGAALLFSAIVVVSVPQPGAASTTARPSIPWPANVTVVPPAAPRNLSACGDRLRLHSLRLPHPRFLSKDSLKKLGNALTREVTFKLSAEEFVAELLQQQEGTYIESGAHDGCWLSHTVGLEEMNWKGVLIEPAPELFAQIVELKRSVWMVNAAIAMNNHVSSMKFLLGGASGGFANHIGRQARRNRWVEHQVTAIPLQTILEKVGFQRVDVWILDVEGAESGILQNLVDSGVGVPARVLCVEHNSNAKNRVGTELALKTLDYTRILAMGQDDWYVSAEVCARTDCAEYTKYVSTPWIQWRKPRHQRVRR